MNKFIKSALILTICILFSTLTACSDTSKKVTISPNTQEEILVEENLPTELINNGKKYLNDKKYDEAMATFNKAIELDKGNKDLYLEVKDSYLETGRLDDAYFVAKTAIANNVDTEDMNTIAEDIANKFEVIEMNYTIEQDSEYYFPNSVNTTINEKTITLPIKWDYSIADTSKPGTFEYYGFNEEYGRKFKLNLTVNEVIYDKQIGSIKNIYIKDGKTYVDVDLVEFYFGNEIALTEALKDNAKIAYKDDGTPYVPDGYYIRDNSSEITAYEVSNNCSFQLLHHDFVETLKIPTNSPGNSSINIISSFDNFRNYIDLKNTMDIDDTNTNSGNPTANRGTLCWIELKNNSAYSIYRQYTP